MIIAQDKHQKIVGWTFTKYLVQWYPNIRHLDIETRKKAIPQNITFQQPDDSISGLFNAIF